MQHKFKALNLKKYAYFQAGKGTGLTKHVL